MRDMVLVGFLQAQNCSNFAGSWRHPDSRSDFASPDYYAHIGRVLEAGKFQLAFFDDRLGMPEFHGGRFAEAVAQGIRCVKMDPIACLMPMAMATRGSVSAQPTRPPSITPTTSRGCSRRST